MSGKIHIELLRLLWVLADNQVKPYYERMRQGNRVGGESFQWARARAFNLNKTSVGWADVFARGTRCTLLVHTLAQPYAEAGRVPRDSGPGASRDNAPHSRSNNVAGHNKGSHDGGPPSAISHGVAQQRNEFRYGLGAAGAASNIAPHAVDAVNLDDNRNVHLDSMLKMLLLFVPLRMDPGEPCCRRIFQCREGWDV